MSRKTLVLVLCAFATLALASVARLPTVDAPPTAASVSHLDAGGTCSDTAPTAGADLSDSQRVPPGCCTSNCAIDKDCDKICGKGNCLCIASSNCCRRCTW